MKGGVVNAKLQLRSNRGAKGERKLVTRPRARAKIADTAPWELDPNDSPGASQANPSATCEIAVELSCDSQEGGGACGELQLGTLYGSDVSAKLRITITNLSGYGRVNLKSIATLGTMVESNHPDLMNKYGTVIEPNQSYSIAIDFKYSYQILRHTQIVNVSAFRVMGNGQPDVVCRDSSSFQFLVGTKK